MRFTVVLLLLALVLYCVVSTTGAPSQSPRSPASKLPSSIKSSPPRRPSVGRTTKKNTGVSIRTQGSSNKPQTSKRPSSAKPSPSRQPRPIGTTKKRSGNTGVVSASTSITVLMTSLAFAVGGKYLVQH